MQRILGDLVEELADNSSLPENLRPSTPQPRFRCPFYGFYGAGSPQGSAVAYFDQRGNQCPFKSGYSPCYMDRMPGGPNLNTCQMFSADDKAADLDLLLDNGTIFPDEFRPAEVKSWSGISLRKFFEYVMGDDCLRPQ